MREAIHSLMLKIVIGLGLVIVASSALLILTVPLYMPYLMELAGR